MDQMIGAFAGAFFAFLFVRIGIALDRIYERQKIHYNALVRLEFIFNMVLDHIGNNRFRIGEITTALKKMDTQPNIIAMTWHKLRQIQIDKTVVDELLNIDFKNDLINYFVEIDKLNSDAENLNSLYQDIKTAWFNKSISREDYRANAEFYAKQLEILNKFLDDLMKKTRDIVVKVRLLLKDKPLFIRFVQKHLTKTKYSDKLLKEIPNEMEKLNKEIEEIERQSQQEKKEILGNK